MKSVMNRMFSQVPSINAPRSSFPRNHGLKTTFDADYLIPIFLDETIPGDTHNLSMTGFARLATPLFPFMDNMYMDTFFFFIPNRLIWDNFKKMMGEQTDPGDSIDYSAPTMVSTASTGYAELSIADYLGLPTKIPDLTHTSLWHRAYNLVFNEWFRDQNLIDSVVVDKDDGPDTVTNYVLLKRTKRHDYFTSALPWPQKGDAVSLPLGTQAPITGIGVNTGASYNITSASVDETENLSQTYANSVQSDQSSPNIFNVEYNSSGGGPLIYADLTNAASATINQLRQAFQIQKLLERDARGGTRYTEIIRSHFGVVSPDQRLQRSEYLGGGSSPILLNPVANQSSGTGADEVGKLSATGVVVAQNHGFTKSFTEHGVILGLVNIRCDLTYQQGLDRMMSRSTRYDWYWPELSHIGEQSILNKEIYAQGSGDAAADAAVFGYQERYAEYRYKQSKITGLYRSNAATPLDAWHLSEEFATPPALNETFINSTSPVDRVIAVSSEPHFYFDGYFKLTSSRAMPVYGVPGLIDHF